MNITNSINETLNNSSSSSSSKTNNSLFGEEYRSSSLSDSGSSSQTWSEYFTSFTWKGWALVIFFLALLGINIFAILGKGTQEVSDIFGPIVKKILGLFVITTGQIVSTSAEGAKSVINTTADVSTTALTDVQNIATPNPSKRSSSSSSTPPPPVPISNPQDTEHSTMDNQKNKEGDVEKTGWCYIGTEDAFRTCAKVGYDDLCMSGDIFPTQEICMNPNLRP